jgi:hypothetical protein
MLVEEGILAIETYKEPGSRSRPKNLRWCLRLRRWRRRCDARAQFGDLFAVVIAPVAVLNSEGGVAHQWAEGVLIERTMMLGGAGDSATGYFVRRITCTLMKVCSYFNGRQVVQAPDPGVSHFLGLL